MPQSAAAAIDNLVFRHTLSQRAYESCRRSTGLAGLGDVPRLARPELAVGEIDDNRSGEYSGGRPSTPPACRSTAISVKLHARRPASLWTKAALRRGDRLARPDDAGGRSYPRPCSAVKVPVPVNVDHLCLAARSRTRQGTPACCSRSRCGNLQVTLLMPIRNGTSPVPTPPWLTVGWC